MCFRSEKLVVYALGFPFVIVASLGAFSFVFASFLVVSGLSIIIFPEEAAMADPTEKVSKSVAKEMMCIFLNFNIIPPNICFFISYKRRTLSLSFISLLYTFIA